MEEEEFQKHVDALAVKRLEQPKKLSAQNARFWSEIISQYYNFDRGNILCFNSVFNFLTHWAII